MCALSCNLVSLASVAPLIADITSLSDWAWLRSTVAVVPVRSVSEICPSCVIPWPPRRFRSRTESMPATREFPVSVFPEAVASSPNWWATELPLMSETESGWLPPPPVLSVSTMRPLAIDAVSLPLLSVALLMSLTTSFSVAAPLRLTSIVVAAGSVSWILQVGLVVRCQSNLVAVVQAGQREGARRLVDGAAGQRGCGDRSADSQVFRRVPARRASADAQIRRRLTRRISEHEVVALDRRLHRDSAGVVDGRDHIIDRVGIRQIDVGRRPAAVGDANRPALHAGAAVQDVERCRRRKLAAGEMVIVPAPTSC